MNIYFTDNMMLASARFQRLAKSTSSKPRKIVIFYQPEESIPYEMLASLVDMAKHFTAIEPVPCKSKDEMVFNIGLLVGKKRSQTQDSYFSLLSDEGMEEFLGAYNVKSYGSTEASQATSRRIARTSQRPKISAEMDDSPEYKEEEEENTKKAEPAAGDTDALEANASVEEPSDKKDQDEDRSSNGDGDRSPLDDGGRNSENDGEAFAGMPAPVDCAEDTSLAAEQENNAADVSSTQTLDEDDAASLVADFRQFKILIGVRVKDLSSYHGTEDDLIKEIIQILVDMEKDGKKLTDVRSKFDEKFGSDADHVFQLVNRNYLVFLKPQLILK